jgi:SAM-dependent methyltransferase
VATTFQRDLGAARRDYAEIYRSLPWAYGDAPDQELIEALTGHPRGGALDIGGGQGRHALALAALGFKVTLVDKTPEGLQQAAEAAEKKGLSFRLVLSDAADYEPEGRLSVVVAGLFFHHPAHRTALKIAKALGAALQPGGIFYLSLPGYNKENAALAAGVIEASGCEPEFIIKHLVTKKERPRLKVARRNETRALARKSRR